jgi:hypothetical protein
VSTFYRDEIYYNCNKSKRIRLDGLVHSRRFGRARLMLVDFLGNRSRSVLLLVVALMIMGTGVFKWAQFGSQLPCGVVRRVDQPYLTVDGNNNNSTTVVYNYHLNDDEYKTSTLLRHNFVLAGHFLFTVWGNSPWQGIYWFLPGYGLAGYFYSFTAPDVVQHCYADCTFVNSTYDQLFNSSVLPSAEEMKDVRASVYVCLLVGNVFRPILHHTTFSFSISLSFAALLSFLVVHIASLSLSLSLSSSSLFSSSSLLFAKFLRVSDIPSLLGNLSLIANVTQDQALHWMALQKCDDAINSGSVLTDVMFAWFTFFLMNIEIIISLLVILNVVASWFRCMFFLSFSHGDVLPVLLFLFFCCCYRYSS